MCIRDSYEGGVLVLNEEKGIALSPAAFPDLLEQVGKQLVVTDGTTLLGADDKAGVAEIFAAVERLVRDPRLAHGRVAVCITPDEEVGRGADYVDLARLGAAFAYTAVSYTHLLLFNLGVREIPYYFSGILMYINPTLKFLVGLLYFGEALQVDQLIAFVIIWAGISVTMVEKGRRIRRERAAWKEGASGG